jgi:MFS family permease
MTESRGGLAPIYVYFGVLTLVFYLTSPSGYLVDIATSYMLKNHLHVSAQAVSVFRLVNGIPIYVAFLFGFARDLWNPLGRKDRGFFIVFGAATAAVYAALAFLPVTYTTLTLGVLLLHVSAGFVGAAYQALLALVGQERLMSGRLAALWQIVATVPLLAGAAASGYVTKYMSVEQIFLLLAVMTLSVCLLGLWKPPAVFEHAYDAPQARGSTFMGDLKRLFSSRAVYPAALLMLMFSFAPGAQTPLQYYLTDRLHASVTAYGNFTAIFVVAFVPMFFLYGWLCKRVKLKHLLFWGTLVSVPQMIPLAFIHTPTQALILAAPIGAMGGIVTNAIYDLAMRSCPAGLQGTLMMMVAAGYALATRGSDLLGSAIYQSSPQYGFVYCVIAITVVYALMLPVLLIIPRHIIDYADGERDAQGEADMLAQIAEAPAPSPA